MIGLYLVGTILAAFAISTTALIAVHQRNALRRQVAKLENSLTRHIEQIDVLNQQVTDLERELGKLYTALEDEKRKPPPERSGYLRIEDGAAIVCLRCLSVSYNANDIQQRYCGRCKVFHAKKE